MVHKAVRVMFINPQEQCHVSLIDCYSEGTYCCTATIDKLKVIIRRGTKEYILNVIKNQQ